MSSQNGTASDARIDPVAYPNAYAAWLYAEQVVRGDVDACKWVRLACQRFLTDLDSEKSEEYPYRFDCAKAEKICKFLQLMPHTKGKWARGVVGVKGSNRIRLEPWQKFILTQLFGWVRKRDGLRRYRKAYICVPRKNGKSIIGAGIGNYMLTADGEYGAEVYSGATTEKQAWEIFRTAWQMAKNTPIFRKKYGVEQSGNYKVPGAIYVVKDGSKFEAVVGQPGDGASPSCALVDEFHEHRTDDLFSTMETGMGAREQPLLAVFTTAGVNTEGPCYAFQVEVQNMLEGTIPNDELFGIVYTIDEGDDWATEAALRKANPNWGVSVNPEIILQSLREAISSARKQNKFKTKHLNIWCGAAASYYNLQQWLALADPELSEEQFVGERCFGGMDLATKIDIAGSAKLFTRIGEDGKTYYYVFGRHYLPEDTVNDEEFAHYHGWRDDGWLTVTDGASTDFDVIKADWLEDAKRFDIVQIGFDAYNATMLASELMKEGVEMVEIPMTTRNLSEPTKELDVLIRDKRIHHNGDPVLAWMIGNVTCSEDNNQNVFPKKETKTSKRKIDTAIALIIALGRAMNQAETGSVYEERGIIYL